ncbi:HEPN domain-containing protein [Rhodopseudomonas rhenobacensis]|uniref:HEPN domain-containing protein n=1 Tax=Rhodopseudomonas rhenobacensis TaxID=87461 RepID=A0A7W8DYW8_9BRAD|nr:HEPN domain-containing protein [Rhodopseudomonas rhenobacensis]MBB5047222.1 HEPN domain-containing protein [Rhodopseudomonas rhenobacensis]
MTFLSRGSLQKAAKAKIDDARLLFENGRFSNAYYLYGYGVELGLKACIARQIIAETVPDPSVLKGFLDHNFTRLVGLSGLAEPLRLRRQDPEFDSRWSIVTEWSVESRYDMIDAITATAMQDAIESPDHGVFLWLHQYW